ncbi:hypothetical protein DIPPA_14740, partial [Diplonema papillatum]
ARSMTVAPRPARSSQGVQATARMADDELPPGSLRPAVLAARAAVRRAQEEADALEEDLLQELLLASSGIIALEFRSWSAIPVVELCPRCGVLSATAGEAAQHQDWHCRDTGIRGRDGLVAAHVAVVNEGYRHMQDLYRQEQADRERLEQAEREQAGPQPLQQAGPQPARQAGPQPFHQEAPQPLQQAGPQP